MRRKISLAAILITIVIAALCVGCTQSSKVRSNLAQESDNFNVYRRVTIIDCITGDVLLQLTGRCSIIADTADHQLEIITEYEEGRYSKQIIGLSDNTSYIVEDIQTTEVSEYHYEINFNPKMWVPIAPDYID